ncbi:MAG: enoyl-CoA hydratase/isomerase family protein [Actinobacteria bacterium]|nr:enoyl-CoA hydratase/isomerase family protein [Actinomycetota bacterium]
MEFTTIDVGSDGARGWIELNRPDKRNALSTTMLAELAAAARWFEDRPGVKVVVVSGRGRSFCAGADLSTFVTPDVVRSPRDAADLGRAMADAIEEMSAVTIARIHGHCVGGGLVLAAACDLRAAAEDTYFSIPEVDLGIPLAWGGIPRLVREIGPALTKELVLTCRPFSAGEAQAAGFLNRVVAVDRLDADVEEVARRLAEKSSFTLRATKRHVDAVTAQAVGIDRSWSDADVLVSALHDEESRSVALAYLERFGHQAPTTAEPADVRHGDHEARSEGIEPPTF